MKVKIIDVLITLVLVPLFWLAFEELNDYRDSISEYKDLFDTKEIENAKIENMRLEVGNEKRKYDIRAQVIIETDIKINNYNKGIINIKNSLKRIKLDNNEINIVVKELDKRTDSLINYLDDKRDEIYAQSQKYIIKSKTLDSLRANYYSKRIALDSLSKLNAH